MIDFFIYSFIFCSKQPKQQTEELPTEQTSPMTSVLPLSRSLFYFLRYSFHE